MSNLELQQSVNKLLSSLQELKQLKELFSELNYNIVNQSLSRRNWHDKASQALAEDPLLLATGGVDQSFYIIYACLKSKNLLLELERRVVSQILPEHPYALFIFSNNTKEQWHFLNVKTISDSQESEDNRNPKRRRLFRRITVAPTEGLRTASERIALLDAEQISQASPLDIQTIHDDAFDVEKVTKQFFNEYKAIFNILQEDLNKQTNDRRWAHDYALQFLNRLMFLYFIQRKGWLGNNHNFLKTFWQSYRNNTQLSDSFVKQWLNILFFEAFNHQFHTETQQFPNSIKEILLLAPYLNGGLFRENELDKLYDFTITDSRFEQILIFLERYNFTITEDSPLDQEVAVDPEMIGKVYESLVNVSNEADERGDAGIFYSPRTEIDLMCRLSLVDILINHLGDKHKSLLYDFVFALEDDEKRIADSEIAKARLWEKIDIQLRKVTVLDPACGSGSFLVGMLFILDDLQQRANQALNIIESAYERKKRIIGQSLYGVDVMDWACRVAELRLWLALIIDADFSVEELHIRREPLLPNFTFKIRQGDALVQEIGGINLRQIRNSLKISPTLKKRIAKIKNEKLKFYSNDANCEFKLKEEVQQEELCLFRDILDDYKNKVEEDVRILRRKIEAPVHEQIVFLPEETIKSSQSRKIKSLLSDWQKQVDSLSQELSRLNQAHSSLTINANVPFVWDIAFVEIFEGEERGFDIVIGNPPYVRQENIANPYLDREKVNSDNKKEYKAKLARSVYQLFPRFFGYKPDKDNNLLKPEKAVSHALDSKSDIYIYFYFHGLSLINTKGSFCFITSNSWLDVDYGTELQEFLLKHCHIKKLIDNRAKRSFVSADVNTVISLFSAPNDNSDWGLKQIAKFIMFNMYFEYLLSASVFKEFEETAHRQQTQEYSILRISQEKLLADGWKWDSNTDTEQKKSYRFTIGSYTGNKWGAKYLRAPDIYWKVLDKLQHKLLKLNDIAEIQRGFTTGANDFFYLDSAEVQKWEIEEDFISPVILRPAEIITPEIKAEYLKLFLLVADKSRSELSGTKVEQYIRWGESQGFDKTATCAARGRKNGEWYRLQAREPAALALPIINKMRLVLGINIAKAQIDNNCIEIRPLDGVDINLTTALMLGSFNFILRHTEGRDYGRMLKIQTYEAERLFLLDPRRISSTDANRLLKAFESLKKRKFEWLIKEIETPERQAFDRVWLSVHGFTSETEQTEALEAIYQAVRNISDQMNAQEQGWVENRPAARQDGNPQDVMKGKRGSGLSVKEHTKRHKRVEAARSLIGIWADLPEGWEDDED